MRCADPYRHRLLIARAAVCYRNKGHMSQRDVCGSASLAAVLWSTEDYLGWFAVVRAWVVELYGEHTTVHNNWRTLRRLGRLSECHCRGLIVRTSLPRCQTCHPSVVERRHRGRASWAAVHLDDWHRRVKSAARYHLIVADGAVRYDGHGKRQLISACRARTSFRWHIQEMYCACRAALEDAAALWRTTCRLHDYPTRLPQP